MKYRRSSHQNVLIFFKKTTFILQNQAVHKRIDGGHREYRERINRNNHGFATKAQRHEGAHRERIKFT